MKPLQERMKRHQGEVDVVIVGSGAGGATLAYKLAQGGFSVVVLEAGPWLDTVKDFRNDELASLGQVDWDDLRECDGKDPLQMGRTNSGRAVGGSTVHFTALKLRLHPEDFQKRSREGVAVDWPFGYDELEPYYREAEKFLAVSGPRRSPWTAHGAPYPQGELPMNAGDERIARGWERMGVRWTMGPHAVLTGPKDGRSPCMYYGFCIQGCKSDAKGSALVTWIPAAVRAGAEIRPECMATRVNVNDAGEATGVTYLHEGQEHEQRARAVVVAGYAVETPRLLLNSATARYPDGLANSSGLVGRNLMVHPGIEVYSRFDEPLDNFVTPPVGIITQDRYGTQPEWGVSGGFTANRYAHFPIEFATALLRGNDDLWGPRLHEVMDAYPYWSVLSTVNEMLPREENRVTLGEAKDGNGLPVPRVTMSQNDDDATLLHRAEEFCRETMAKAGAREILSSPSTWHLLGTCRMGNDPATSVVNAAGRAHDHPNLFVCDGSVLPTVGGVNPSLTIEAIALRTGRRMLDGRTD